MRRSLLVGLVAVLMSGLVVILGPQPASAAVVCTAIQPDPSPAVNYQNISGCLQGSLKQAKLNAGTFLVDRPISMPSGSVLDRAPGVSSFPTVRLTTAQQMLINFSGGNARVSFLTLQANGLLTNTCCSAVALFQGSSSSSGNMLNDSFVEATNNPWSPYRKDTGVYFLCGTCTGNTALRLQVRNSQSGFIVNTATGFTGATIQNSGIYNNGCDGISLRPGTASATITGNDIYNNGPVCDDSQGHIPASGIYAIDNTYGFKVDSNNSHDNCGMSMDFVHSGHLQITNNTMSNPGNTSLAASCKGSVTFGMMDVSASTISGNQIYNSGRASNAVGQGSYGDSNQLFKRTVTGADYTDLPAGGNTAIATLFAAHRAVMTAQGNTISNNYSAASCTLPCVGLGIFTSRGTGIALDGSWSGSTTNYFTDNRVVGSNIGSRRGGGNWWAANSNCVSGSPSPCNDDDYQHDAAHGGDWARNDVGYDRYG